MSVAEAAVTVVGLVAAVALAWWLTGVARSRAIEYRVLDLPNERSSHDRPTPRGGGLAIVLTATVGFVVLAACKHLDARPLVALLGGIPIAVVGFADDVRELRASIRLAAHVATALWAVAWLGGLPDLPIGGRVLALGAGGYLVASLVIIWSVNLFNFMDGIDGIAGMEAVFVALTGGILITATGESHGIATAALMLAAACAGFLRWNWPPAKVFMGDVGSGYVGYVLAVLALASAHEHAASVWVWLILGGVFFVDATATLMRRLIRGERVHEAHRSHAYQWLARRWGSHLRVTLAALMLNVLWLLPCAIYAALHPADALSAAAVALAPLAVMALIAGSGRREATQRNNS